MRRKLQIIWYLLKSRGYALYFVDKKGGMYRFLTNVTVAQSRNMEDDLADIREKTETDGAVNEANAIINSNQKQK